MDFTDFITLETLSTIKGAVAVVAGLTQATKLVTRRIDPKVVALCIAAVVSVIKQAAFGDFTLQGWGLAGLNALVIFAAAVGFYECCKTVHQACTKYEGGGEDGC